MGGIGSGRKRSHILDTVEDEAYEMAVHEMRAWEFTKVHPHSIQARICRLTRGEPRRFKSIVGVDRIYIIRIK